MSYSPKEPRNAKGEWAAAGGSEGTGKRYSQMNNREKARLNSSARFNTKFSGGKAIGVEPRSAPERAFGPSVPNKHAVVIQTAKALDRDFQQAKDNKAHAEMKAAIAKHKGKITKLPPGEAYKK